jgi:hypothetical protein
VVVVSVGVRRRAAFVAVAVSWALGCEPSLDQRTQEVTTPRVLAIRAEPAEAPPGGKVALTSLYVDANGDVTGGAMDWAFCLDRNPLANLDPVNPTCAAGAGAGLLHLGGAIGVTSAVPTDACKQFGPEVPSPQPNQPPGRPVDPDVTGGFYQPVRFAAGGEVAVGLVRITCGFPGATSDQLDDLNAHDHPNTNPALDALTDPSLGTLAPLGTGMNHVAPGQRLTLRAHWAACDPQATSCSGAEGYALLDPASHAVVHAREQMRVSWLTTAGSFDADHTGRGATDQASTSDNAWTAPSSPGTVRIWVVLRDDRGGVGWGAYAIDVR